ncbi:MAG: hypothetical protein JSV82_04220, partial [Planctomycetota bacterium]
MPSSIWSTLKRLKWLLLIIALLYMASIVGGLVTRCAGCEVFASLVERSNENSTEQVEKIFGRFRQPVREGNIGIIALCSLIVLAINTLANFINFTLPGILIVPIVLTLLLGGWIQGISLASIQASSFLSLF